MASTSSTERRGTIKRISTYVMSTIDSGLASVSYLAEKTDRIVTNNKEPTEDDPFNSPVAEFVERLRAQLKRGTPIDPNSDLVAGAFNALTSKGSLDDRLMLLEDELVLLSRLPPDHPITHKLRHKTNTILWNDLAHPPATLVGDGYQFRTADGSGTSIWFPEMGKANTPYARSVTSTHPVPADQLPEPGLLFDALLKREKPIEHPAGLSSFFFAFANLVIHEIFNTDRDKPSGWNKTSSYVDLAIIYGNNIDEQRRVRVYDGTGHIHPDTFADFRLTKMAPATPALLVLFCRNHNVIADRLLEINERRRWTKNIASLTDKDKKLAQDEEIFQTTRLIMCGFFISIVLGDYLAGILGLVRDANPWSLDILEEFRDDAHKLIPRGEGNHSSIEFVALYHWHATISQRDVKWFEKAFGPRFSKPLDQITPEEFKAEASAKGKAKTNKKEFTKDDPPNTWEFGGLTRGSDGKFNDDDLANELYKAILEPANTFGARSTPSIMRAVEMMAIEQNRQWGACSLNEFRKFLGLKQFETFDEWNPDPEVAGAAERLYKHPDNLELYVGLQAEAAKPVRAGAGLCPGYTVSRAILADAIALTRGDRFLTTDFTSFNLTAWGINQCKRDPKNSSNGGQLGRVLSGALPNHFPADSSFTCFPMIVPSKMREYLSAPGVRKNHLYTYEEPTKKGPVTPITSWAGANDALTNPNLAASYPANAKWVLPGAGYLTDFNNQTLSTAHHKLISEAFAQPDDIKQHALLLKDITTQLLQDKSYNIVGGAKRSVDVVGDIANLVPIHFVANAVLGLSVKKNKDSAGLYFENELRTKLTEIYEFILLDQKEPSTHVAKREVVQDHCEEIHRQVERNIRAATSHMPFASLATSILNTFTGKSSDIPDVLEKMGASGKPTTELANDAVALGVILAMELGQALTHVIETLLQPDMKSGVAELLRSSDANSSLRLNAFISESLRLQPVIGGVYREVTSNTKLRDGRSLTKGDRVFISVKDANRDAIRFKDPGPETLAGNRPHQSVLYGDGIVRLLGETWLLEAITAVIRVVFSLKGLDRAAGNSGTLRSFNLKVHGTTQRSYFDKRQFDTPWASSLTVTYDK